MHPALILFCGLAVIMSYMAIEEVDSIKSILLLLGFTICLGILFILITANFVGYFHLLVYSGVITILFSLTSHYAEPNQITKEAVA